MRKQTYNEQFLLRLPLQLSVCHAILKKMADCASDVTTYKIEIEQNSNCSPYNGRLDEILGLFTVRLIFSLHSIRMLALVSMNAQNVLYDIAH